MQRPHVYLKPLSHAATAIKSICNHTTSRTGIIRANDDEDDENDNNIDNDDDDDDDER